MNEKMEASTTGHDAKPPKNNKQTIPEIAAPAAKEAGVRSKNVAAT
jgi:hypothetical protein